MAENTSVTYRLQSPKISDFRGTILFRFIWKQANGLQRSHIMAPWMSLRKRSLWSSSLQQPHVVLWMYSGTKTGSVMHYLSVHYLAACQTQSQFVGARSTGVRKKKGRAVPRNEKDIADPAARAKSVGKNKSKKRSWQEERNTWRCKVPAFED